MKRLKYRPLNSTTSVQLAKEMTKTSFYVSILLCSLFITPAISQGKDICSEEYCTCGSPQDKPDLINVICECTEKKVLRIGSKSTPQRHNARLLLPEKATSLQLKGCHHVEIFEKTFNHVTNLKDVTISGSGKVKLHSRMYESRNGGTPPSFNLFEIKNVRHLHVSQYAFQGIRVDGSFLLTEVQMEKIASFAFNFDFVHDFTIFNSTIDRIAMWGFKLTKCNEFNVLGGSKLFSLASNAFDLHCNKFMLSYNIFDNLHDASVNVKAGFINIQGNTFETFTGKPLIKLEPLLQREIGNGSKPGFVFRENKFKADPILPFNALAMPAFDLVHYNTEAYVNIEDNHFLCDCSKVGWFVGAMTHGFDRSVIADGRGNLDFLQKLYDTSGKCLECTLRRCDPVEGKSFKNFARSALIKHGETLTCSVSGQPLKSQKQSGNGFDGEDGKYLNEEGLAELKNMEWNGELSNTQAAHSIRIKITHLLNASFITFFLSVTIVRRVIVSVE